MILNENVAVAQYTMTAGDRVRLLWQYGGRYRPFFWFTFGADGSVYLGARYENPVEARRGIGNKTEDGVQFLYDDGEICAGDGGKLVSKISAHASGRIHTLVDPDVQMIREPLRDLAEQTALCLGVFQHPSVFEPVEALRKRDVAIDYPFVEEMPVWLHLHIAPQGEAKLVKPTTAIDQVNLLFNCGGFEGGTPDLTAQATLCHGVKGPWPKASYMVFPVDEVVDHRT